MTGTARDINPRTRALREGVPNGARWSCAMGAFQRTEASRCAPFRAISERLPYVRLGMPVVDGGCVGRKLIDMDYSKIITIEPGKRGGKPCIRGLRITVADVLDYFASGMTNEQILEDFPELNEQDLRACLAFAADRERRLTVIP